MQNFVMKINSPVDGANVVQTPAGYEASRRRVRARHDPRGPERDGVDLVGAVAVPHDQLAVLGGGDQISTGRKEKQLGKVVEGNAEDT